MGLFVNRRGENTTVDDSMIIGPRAERESNVPSSPAALSQMRYLDDNAVFRPDVSVTRHRREQVFGREYRRSEFSVTATRLQHLATDTA